jgi:hypothetical protein
MRNDVIAAIRQAAIEEGVDPNFALAVAQRESDFDPHAHASKSIYGVFQMTGDLRRRHGAGNSDDPYVQAKSWMSLLKNDIRPEMRSVLGRNPTDIEAYLGHHFGAARAARMLSHYDPNTPVDQIFTPYERSLNPHFDRAGTAGNLMSSIGNDIGRRTAKFGNYDYGNYGPYANWGGGQGTSTGALDFSEFGNPVDLERESNGGQSTGGVDFSSLANPVDLSQGQATAPAQSEGVAL